MYNDNDESKNYFLRNLIAKILLILLFIFLLMWLFPMPNLSPFYDKIFAQNIKTMTDAAKSYYTVERLPQEEGETKTLTLQEMLDNKMIIEFTDSEGKKCDTEESYVEVTKKDGEYVYKTNLSCSNQEDYVIEYFGCYDVCDDCNVSKKGIEYQFYKDINQSYIDSYVCSNGYTLSGKSCISKISKEISKPSKPVCEDGYTYNSDSKKCEKQVVEENDATITYKCDSGELKGDKCVTSTVSSKAALSTTTCPSGYSKSGTTCVKTVSCSTTCSGWTCSTVGYKYAMSTTSSANFTRKYLYQSGTTRYYEECSRNCSCTGGGTYYANPTVSYYCDSADYTLSGTTCYKTVTNSVDAKKEYSCTIGNLDGNKCKITTTEHKDVKNYVCEDGYTLKDGICYATTVVDNIIDATAVYKYRTVKTYKWSTEEKLDGWIRTGEQREITLSA